MKKYDFKKDKLGLRDVIQYCGIIKEKKNEGK